MPNDPDRICTSDVDRSRQVIFAPITLADRNVDGDGRSQRTSSRSATANIHVAGEVATHSTVHIIAEHSNLSQVPTSKLAEDARRIFITP